ncbi:non-ribosomal peptide synthetase [Streptomyces sp. 150FB]|uniref:non-ribosomal peptide synthetase n=1 Tax=Streptomyces sp. 150FB TaxID=1576605 RepID=UPI00136496C1|nr:non-ribosomal peptide synthetase [Streptomyces sp. 150FB]
MPQEQSGPEQNGPEQNGPEQSQPEHKLKGQSGPERNSAAPGPPVPGGTEAIPLTASQTEAWILHELDPLSPAGNVGGHMDLRAEADPELLRRSFALAWEESGVMNAAFLDTPDGPAARRIPGPAHVSVHDLRSEPDPEAAMDAWIEKDRLSTPDLRRHSHGHGHTIAAVFVLEDRRIAVHGRSHHILMDGYSIHLVFDRAAAIYTALVAGEEIPPCPFGPAEEFVAADLAYRRSTDHAADRAYWRDYCADRPPVFSLATYGGRVLPDFHRATLEAGPGVVSGLSLLGRRLRTGWPAVFAAAVAAYLRHRTGADDLFVGVPVTGRAGALARRTPLYASNIVPLRVRFDAGSTVGSLVGGISHDLKAALRHQRYRIEHTLRDLGTEPGTPLYGALVNVHQSNRGLEFGPDRADSEVTSVGVVDDLSISAVPGKTDGLSVHFDGNTGLYSAEALAREAEGFVELLRALVGSGPGTPVTDLAPRSVPSYAGGLAGWNDTGRPFPDRCLHELVAEQAVRTPGAVAVSDADGELTYAGLDRRANALAHRLVAAGVGPDVPVGVLVDRSVELAVALLGVLKAGGAYLPIDPEAPSGRARTLLAEAGAPVCVTRDEAAGTEREAALGIRVVGVDTATAAGGCDAPPDVSVLPGHLVSVFFTSGSTGVPKAAANSHAGWVNRLSDLRDKHPLAVGEVVLQKTVIGFDDSAVELFWPLLSGATCHFLPPGLHRDPAAIVRTAAERGVVALFFVPVVLGLFLAEITAEERARLSALRDVFTSGEALPPGLVRLFEERLGGEGRRLHNHWGVTEASIDSTVHTCTPRDAEARVVPIGLPLGNARMYVLDEALRPSPAGVPGDLYLGGTGLARGYWRDPAKTAAAFVPDPSGDGGRLYRTGDRGIRRVNGEIVFLGRADGQLKINGVRVEPGEIEQTLRRHPGVGAAVVVKSRVGADGEALVAYVVAADGAVGGAAPGGPELAEFTAAHLPRAMVPGTFRELPELPLTTSGKVDRQALSALRSTDPGPVAGSVPAPRTPTERLIADVMSAILGVPEIDVHASFFALGGHSVMAMKAATRIKRESGTSFPVALIFQHPSVAQLGAALDALRPVT